MPQSLAAIYVHLIYETAEQVAAMGRRSQSIPDSDRTGIAVGALQGGQCVPNGVEGPMFALLFHPVASSARTGSARIARGVDRANNFTIRFTLTTSAVNNTWTSTLGRPR